MPAVVAQTFPLAAWDLQAEEWFFLANRKCHVGKRLWVWSGWVLFEQASLAQRDRPALGGGGEGHRSTDAPVAPCSSAWTSG